MDRRLRLAQRLHRYRAARERQHRAQLLARRSELEGVRQQMVETLRAMDEAVGHWSPGQDPDELLRLQAYLDLLRQQLQTLLQRQDEAQARWNEAVQQHMRWWRQVKLAEALVDRIATALRQQRDRRLANELDDLVLRLRDHTRRTSPEATDAIPKGNTS